MLIFEIYNLSTYYEMYEIIHFWKNPALMTEALLHVDSKKLNVKIYIILFLIGLQALLFNPKYRIDATNWNDPLKVIGFISIIALFPLFIKYVLSFLFWTVSKLFDGHATRWQLQIVLTYSLTPYLILLPFTIFWYIISLIHPQLSNYGNNSNLINTLFSTLAFCFLIIGLKKVNRYSNGYSLATVIIIVTFAELIKLLMR